MKLTRLLALAAFALPVLAHAHPGHEGHDLTWDFVGGAAHPLSGWDHLLAMTAVGLWAGQLGGRSRWLVPAAFVGMMMVGAAVGTIYPALPGVEASIAASVLILGLLIAFTAKLPPSASMAIVGAFAFFHGLAHGASLPTAAGAFSYASGFVASTVGLHAAGLALGSGLRHRDVFMRFAGGAIALAGVVALAT